MLVKKYGNRRLYDTEQSRYVRLDEIAERIRAGADVQVVDAKTGADLTAPTLAQIIFEDRNAARLLPVPLLLQLIRMGDEPAGGLPRPLRELGAGDVPPGPERAGRALQPVLRAPALPCPHVGRNGPGRPSRSPPRPATSWASSAARWPPSAGA